MSTAYVHARLFAATGTDVIEGGAIVVEGDRIAWVGRVRGAPHRGTSRSTRGQDDLPGLCDAHVHLIYDESRTPTRSSSRSPLEQAAVDAA